MYGSRGRVRLSSVLYIISTYFTLPNALKSIFLSCYYCVAQEALLLLLPAVFAGRGGGTIVPTWPSCSTTSLTPCSPTAIGTKRRTYSRGETKERTAPLYNFYNHPLQVNHPEKNQTQEQNREKLRVWVSTLSLAMEHFCQAAPGSTHDEVYLCTSVTFVV